MSGLPPIRWSLGRVPVAIGGLIGATALVSIAAAVGARNGAPALLDGGLLIVPEIFRGQIWRLVSWVLYELDALPLVFACLTLYWFGTDLARSWGTRRFLGFYFGLAALAAAVTAVLGRFVWPAVSGIAYAGSWPVLDGMVIAWGLLFAQRRILLFGIVPLTGRHLVWLTLGGTVLYALFRGAALYVPHFVAELAVLFWLTRRRRGAAPRKPPKERAPRAEAWSFDAWFDRERRRKR